MNRGFSLIEMAIVVFVMALVLGGFMVPLQQRAVERQRTDTRKALQEIEVALLGFAMTRGRLPCPDNDTVVGAPGYGLEEPSCLLNQTAEGYLPVATLGLQQWTDAYGERWRYRVDRNFANGASPITLATLCSADALKVVDAAGALMHDPVVCPGLLTGPAAVAYSTGPNLVPDGQNAVFEQVAGIYEAGPQTLTFDDVVLWVSPHVLKGRLVAAGRLP